MRQHIDRAEDNAGVAAILESVDALSQLLALNSSVEHARGEIEVPFTVTANRVTEHAHRVEPARLRSVGAPVLKAVQLGAATATVLAGLQARTQSTDQPIAAEPSVAEGLGR